MYRKGTALLTSALLVFMGAGLYAAEDAAEREGRALERPGEQIGEHGTWEGRVVDLKSYLMEGVTEERGVEQPAQQREQQREQPGEFDQPAEQAEPRGLEQPGTGEAKGPYALIVEEEGVLGTPLGEATSIYVLLFEEEDPADEIRAIEREQPAEDLQQREGLDQQERDEAEGLLQEQREQRGIEEPGDEQRGIEEPGAEQRGLEEPGAEQRGIEEPGAEHEFNGGATWQDAQQMVGQEVRVTGRMLERDGFEAIMVERLERYTATDEVEEQEQEEDVLDF